VADATVERLAASADLLGDADAPVDQLVTPGI
jgi:hypothetical protein